MIFQDRRVEDGVVIEAVVYRVDESEQYPQGIRYSFQAHSEGKTLLRYDNYNRHAGSRHHKHIGESETERLENPPEEENDVVELYKKFLNEVTSLNE